MAKKECSYVHFDPRDFTQDTPVTFKAKNGTTVKVGHPPPQNQTTDESIDLNSGDTFTLKGDGYIVIK